MPTCPPGERRHLSTSRQFIEVTLPSRTGHGTIVQGQAVLEVGLETACNRRTERAIANT